MRGKEGGGGGQCTSIVYTTVAVNLSTKKEREEGAGTDFFCYNMLPQPEKDFRLSLSGNFLEMEKQLERNDGC